LPPSCIAISATFSITTGLLAFAFMQLKTLQRYERFLQSKVNSKQKRVGVAAFFAVAVVTFIELLDVGKSDHGFSIGFLLIELAVIGVLWALSHRQMR
jgi:hypothetical protein